MESTPRISVIMSVYNSALFLREAVDSILNQTFGDFEFLIVDDKSTDHSLEILKSFLDHRIQIFENPENIGLTKSLNKLLKVAKGEFIARMDADDISLPLRFKKQVSYLEKNPLVVMCGTQIQEIGTDVVSSYPTDNEVIKFDLLWTNPIAHPTTFWRNEWFKSISLYYNEKFKTSQDYELWCKMPIEWKISNIDEILLLYRKHNGQISNSKSGQQIIDSIKVKKLYFNSLNLKLPSLNDQNYNCAFNNGLKEHHTCSDLKALDNFLSDLYKYNQQKRIFTDKVIERFWVNKFYGSELYFYSPKIYFTIRKLICSKKFNITIKKKILLSIKSLIFHRVQLN